MKPWRPVVAVQRQGSLLAPPSRGSGGSWCAPPCRGSAVRASDFRPETSYPSPKTSHPGLKTSCPGPKASYPRSKISYPGSKTLYPGLKTSYLGSLAIFAISCHRFPRSPDYSQIHLPDYSLIIAHWPVYSDLLCYRALSSREAVSLI